ncbi:MAG: endonuclease/exonuclease/phosphatase family protein [Alistipes sp.]|nr:endonuclease/exonuclease/phosphatase family protein [Alistipes sp.]
MSDYYRTTYSSTARRSGRSVVGIVADLLFAVVTVLITSLFVMTLLVPRLDPRGWGEVTTLGLVAPFVYAAQVLMTLYWIIRWRMWVAVPMILVTMMGLFNVSSFYKMEVRRTYANPKYDRMALKVMTYNVRNFVDDRGQRNLDSMAAMIKSINPDILCFQEFTCKTALDTLLKPMYPMPKDFNTKDLSPYIYSRYPIINADRIDGMKEFAWADVVIRDDTMRVFSLHLHSTTIQKADKDYLENHEYIDDEESNEQLRSMLDRLTENNKLRAAQVDTISYIISSSPYPVIVCGDFNDTPISYTYRNMSRRMRDTYREQGRGYAHTYRGFFGLMKIDYILCSKSFDVLSYEVIDSWGWETQRTRSADTIVVRRYGNKMPLIGEGVRERLDVETLNKIDNDSEVIDNEVNLSDHYPVMARLLYNKPTN